jgi:hypothetical protein
VTGMPRPSFDREAIEAEIGRVRSLGLDALRTLWRVTFRSSPPPAFSKDLMARFLCWHIQEQAQPQSISTASHGTASRERIAPGASSPAQCSCANTRARLRSENLTGNFTKIGPCGETSPVRTQQNQLVAGEFPTK